MNYLLDLTGLQIYDEKIRMRPYFFIFKSMIVAPFTKISKNSVDTRICTGGSTESYLVERK